MLSIVSNDLVSLHLHTILISPLLPSHPSIHPAIHLPTLILIIHVQHLTSRSVSLSPHMIELSIRYPCTNHHRIWISADIPAHSFTSLAHNLDANLGIAILYRTSVQ